MGLLIGVLGGIFFGQSLPPDPGSEQERAEKAEHRLRVAEAQVRRLQGSRIRADRQRSAEGGRNILEDIREGRGADLNDIFAVTKPWLNDLSPVINLMRSKEEREQFARLAGDYTRKYDLNESHEGTMLFFPAKLRHQVYPFYNCDEERISVSGNILVNTSKRL